MHYGEKHNRELTGAQISAAIRRDIKQAVATGELAAAKYSVTLKTFSGGQSITVRISEVPFDLFEKRFLRHELDTKGRVFYEGERYSEKLRALLKQVKKLADAYNFNDSDLQTDYFHVNYYLNVAVDHTFEAEQRKRELDAVRVAMNEEREALTRKRWEDLDQEPSPEDSPIMRSMRRRQADARPWLGLPRATTEAQAETLDVAPLVITAAAAMVTHAAVDWWIRRRVA